MKIHFFHGSPGAPEDFALVTRALGSEHSVVARARKGFPGAGPRLVLSGPRILVGYSWGCAAALLESARNPEGVQGVLLVAPYLFPQHGVSAVKKILLNTPLLGSMLLRKMAPGIVEKLLIETSAPREVSVEYRECGKRYLAPSVLRTAALEKDISPVAFLDALAQLRSRGIPLAIIRGDQDPTTDEEHQLAPIRGACATLFEECLPEAGHALLWTHPAEVAKAIGRLSNFRNGEKQA